MQRTIALLGTSLLGFAAAAVDFNVSALVAETIESDWTTTYYSQDSPLLVGNDGGASTGGFHAWNLNADEPLTAVESVFAGRTKLVSTLYNIAGKDYLVSISQTTSRISLYELPDVSKVDGAGYFALGDWAALCSWKSQSKNDYLFLFGKREAIQFLVRSSNDESGVEILRIQTFALPFEFAGCAVSHASSQLFLIPDDGEKVYFFSLNETTEAPILEVLGELEDTVTGIAVYASEPGTDDYLFVGLENAVAVYQYPWDLVGTLDVVGLEELEIQGLSMHQASLSKYPDGVLAYAVEAEDVQGFGISSLGSALAGLNIPVNTEYDPGNPYGCRKQTPITEQCSFNGFAQADDGCECFAGFSGEACSEVQCQDDCSGNGTCVGPDTCDCHDGWGGLHCSFVIVEPEFETDANGEDGDDPAIWVSPVSPELSRIITTTKAGDDAGLAVFDLEGNQLQLILAPEPNNVDIIYGFQAGNRTVDLAYAACRGDNTLCIFEIREDGELAEVDGGIQPSDVEDELYGSCVYRSQKTGKQYLFANEKSARYMQYELTAFANGTLHTTLVREFVGGSGGQVEGCVTDEDNGWLILGEEPSALWRYDAEPDGSTDGFRIAFVGDGKLYGDVEGVTLVNGKTKDEGFFLVSCQGVSAYNIYERAAPHAYVATFTIRDSSDGQIDHVTNTDGLAAIGSNLGPLFPDGVLVVHDDTNELPGGGADPFASYKIIGLDKVLGAPALKELNLLEQVDADWNPRD